MKRMLGFVGLGNMGRPISHRLIDAGYDLVVTDVDADACAQAGSHGATAVGSAAEVADRAEVILTSLPNPSVVREVVLGESGLVNGKELATWVDLSTTGAETVRAVSEALSRRGISTVDSPVSGGVHGASAGTLAVMVAADPRVFESVEQVLEIFGDVFYVGTEPGLGQTMKVANNYLSATAMAATSEAVVFGLKAGLDAGVMIDVFNSGSGKNTATLDKFPRSVLPRTFDYGFSTGLMLKDLQLLSEQAGQMQLPMWVAESVRQLWTYALVHGGADVDFTTLVTHLEEWAGVEARRRDGTE